MKFNQNYFLFLKSMKSVKFLQIFVKLQPLLPLLLQNTKLKRLNGKKERKTR